MGIFLTTLLLFLLQTGRAIAAVNFHAELFQRKETIVIDPGHGGEDGGTVGINGVQEKEVNLAVALALRDLLVQDHYHVVMIREGDYAVGDRSLAELMERKRSDIHSRLQTVVETGDCIYVGIHQNNFSQSKYSGAQTFYSVNHEGSALLAEKIQTQIVQTLQRENTREIKASGDQIYILKNCQVPAVLVECGFLSNPAEAEKLIDPQYQREMASAIFQGIQDYYGAEPVPPFLSDSVSSVSNDDKGKSTE